MKMPKKWKNFNMNKIVCKACGAELDYTNIKEVNEFVIEGGASSYRPFDDELGEIGFVFECPECKTINEFEFAVMFEKMRRIEESE